MIELNNSPDKPHRKCARIIGDTIDKYHPHGDSSIRAGPWPGPPEPDSAGDGGSPR